MQTQLENVNEQLKVFDILLGKSATLGKPHSVAGCKHASGKHKKLHSPEQITEFCVYFSKRLKKSIFDMQTGRSKGIAFDGKYVYEFYPNNSVAQTQALLDAAMAEWEEQLKCCAVCPSKCLMDEHAYEITGMFDSLE